MDEREIRLRCIEAAAKTPMIHNAGVAAGVVEVATAWFNWIISKPEGSTLGLPKKK